MYFYKTFKNCGSLCYIYETYIILYINYTSIKTFFLSPISFIAKSYRHAVPTKRKILLKEQMTQQGKEKSAPISFNLTPHCYSLGNDL